MTLTVVLLTAYVAAALFVFWLVTKRERVVRPTTFEDQVRKFSEAMRQVQVAFADALTPALREATDSINRFHEAMTKAEQNTGKEPSDG